MICILNSQIEKENSRLDNKASTCISIEICMCACMFRVRAIDFNSINCLYLPL